MFKDLTKRDNLFFVGDLHGQWDAFNYAYKQLGITGWDMVVSVGDVIDRGDKSVECLDFFMTASNAIMVRGNHEDMFIEGVAEEDSYNYNMHLYNGGGWMLDYPETYVKSLAIRAFKELPYHLTIKHGDKTFGVVHAQCPCDSWDTFLEEHPKNFSIYQDSMWGRDKILDPKFEGEIIEGVDFTIHGHTPDKDVRTVGNQIFIDTGGQAINTEYGLTFLQWDGDAFTKHTVNYDPLEGGYVMNSEEVDYGRPETD